MVVYTLEQRCEILRHYFCQFWQKKNHLFRWSSFDLGGYVNKQNYRIWGTENPKHSKRVTVWCGFYSGGIIGSFFFENELGEAVKVNGDRWTNFCSQKFKRRILATAEATFDVLRPVFEERIISRRADVVWPPRFDTVGLLFVGCRQR